MLMNKRRLGQQIAPFFQLMLSISIGVWRLVQSRHGMMIMPDFGN